MRMIHRLTIPMLLSMMLGCSSNEESELAAMARRELDRMSAQSESLMRHSQEVSETARHLVEADANARKELTEFQSRLQADIESERQNVDRQRDELESERRQIARDRNRDPIIAAALVQSTTLVLAALPLVICLFLFRAVENENAEVAVGEMLVHELLADEPLLLNSLFENQEKQQSPRLTDENVDQRLTES